MSQCNLFLFQANDDAQTYLPWNSDTDDISVCSTEGLLYPLPMFNLADFLEQTLFTCFLCVAFGTGEEDIKHSLEQLERHLVNEHPYNMIAESLRRYSSTLQSKQIEADRKQIDQLQDYLVQKDFRCPVCVLKGV